jgi:hypothetical protein
LILVREKEPEVDQRSQKMPSLPTGDQRFESPSLQQRVRRNRSLGNTCDLTLLSNRNVSRIASELAP